ncbi:MAG: phage tail tape measure protein [Bacteroidales bacterium]
MEYGVKFDILLNSQAAVAGMNRFQMAVEKSTPKIIADLKRLNQQIGVTSKALSNITVAANSLNRINLSRARREFSSTSAQLRGLRSKTITVTTRHVTQNMPATTGVVTTPSTTTTAAGVRGGGRRQAFTPIGGMSSKKLLPTSFLAGLSVPLITMGATAIFGRFVRDMIMESAQFEDTMTSVRNILRTTDKEASTFEGRFKRVSDNMQQIGVDTKFTSLEIAGASKYLAMAGQDLETINASMKPIASLAALSDTPIDKVADVVTNIMAGYGIAAKDIEAASDVIASAATSTNTSVLEMAESFKFASRPLQMAGISFNEGAAAIGILANAGVKGTLAGTAIRAMMIRLTNPTTKASKAIERLGVNLTQTVNGVVKMRSLSDIFKDFRKAGASVADMYEVFDKIAGGASTAVYQSLLQLDYLTDKTSNAGGIAEFLAAEKMKTVVGLWDQITSQVKYLNQSVFNSIEPTLKAYQTEFLNWLKTNDAKVAFMQVGEFIKEVISLAKSLFLFLYENFEILKNIFIGKFFYNRIMGLANVIGSVVTSVTALTTTSTTAAAAVGGISAGATALVSVVGGVLAAFGVLAYDVWRTQTKTNDFIQSLQEEPSKFLTLEKIEDNLSRIQRVARGASSDIDLMVQNAMGEHGKYYNMGFWGTALSKTINAVSSITPESWGAKQVGNYGMFAVEQLIPNKVAKMVANTAVEESMKEIYSSAPGSPEQLAAISNVRAARADFEKKLKTAPSAKFYADEKSTFDDLSKSHEAISGAITTIDSYLNAATSIFSDFQKGSNESIISAISKTGVGGIKSMTDFYKPGTSEVSKSKVREVYEGLMSMGMPSKSIVAYLSQLGLGKALKSTVSPVVEFDANLRSNANDAEDAMRGLSLSNGKGSGISSRGGSKNIIVNIQNLMNVENANLEGNIENIKDKMAQALLDVVKDFEMAYN